MGCGRAALILALGLTACTVGGGVEPEPTPVPAPGASSGAPATAPATPPDPSLQPSEPFDRTTVTLRGEGGRAVTLDVYDAASPSARQRGLMERDELPPGTGMVFRFPTTGSGAFWMWRTPLPLSIAFFDADGGIVDILRMEPCLEPPSSACPRYEPGGSYVGALEVEQGLFAELGVTREWTVELPDGLPPPQCGPPAG